MPPGLATVKTLFALSCNRCAFPGCDERLADSQWEGVRADLAHIRGERVGAPRYDPDMTDAERNAVENIVILCPNHHREIDRLRPQDWSAGDLMRLKAEHEEGCENRQWASDGIMEHYASLLIATPSATAPIPTGVRPALVLQRGRGDTFEVVNNGEADAFNVRVEAANETAGTGHVRIENETAQRLSPGASWTAGMHARALGQRGTPVIRVRWSNAEGDEFDGEFPL
jgi:hypothetical protein